MLRKLTTATLVALCVTAAPAFAHTGAGAAHDLTHGFMHPLTGLDHIVVMVAVGLFAASLGGRALWLVPLAFLGTMILGGLLGYQGVALPMVETMIGVSVVAMGLAIALGLKLPTVAAMALVGIFALFHGAAHGSEGAGLASFAEYAAGFVAATALLHAAGIGLGLALDRLGALPSSILKRAAGVTGALAGVAILAS